MADWFLALPHTVQALLATLFTWGVTALGAGLVFFFRTMNKNALDAMLGFAAGVMTAASFWSLLSPAIELAGTLGMNVWATALLGFLGGGALLYLGDRQLAEDAFQETMVKAWRALPGFRGESGAKTWLFHIAVNTCRDMLRTGWMRMRRRSVPLEVMPELAGQEDERLREMTAAVLALPDKYRETVVLFYYKQMKIREITEALHIPQNSVSSRLRRARAMLQIDMEGGKDA